jgi:hypothetical protein
VNLAKKGEVTEGDEAAPPRGRKKQGRGLDALAMRELRAAHKLFKEGDGSAAEANFMVAYANVLATLDLASAIREANGVSTDD